MALVELDSVHKSYMLGTRTVGVLRGIDLCIGEGEFVGIWGPSGSGKSTLCNVIGLLDLPTSGRVFFQGNDVTSLSDDRTSELRNSSIGFVFQRFNLLPVLSALENVVLPLEVLGIDRRQALKTAQRLLGSLNVGRYAHTRPDRLSGGEQQRVAIARALVTGPSLIIADEPTANLDSETALQIIDLMRQLNENNNTTFLFATHDARLLNKVTRKIKLRDGAIIEDCCDSSAHCG